MEQLVIFPFFFFKTSLFSMCESIVRGTRGLSLQKQSSSRRTGRNLERDASLSFELIFFPVFLAPDGTV